MNKRLEALNLATAKRLCRIVHDLPENGELLEAFLVVLRSHSSVAIGQTHAAHYPD